MLVITRRQGELVVFNDNIFVKVLEAGDGESNKIRLAIEAPDEVRIVRGEFLGTREEIQQKIDAVHAQKSNGRKQRGRGRMERTEPAAGTLAEGPAL